MPRCNAIVGTAVIISLCVKNDVVIQSADGIYNVHSYNSLKNPTGQKEYSDIDIIIAPVYKNINVL
jgi:hypothetical protein